MTGAQVDLGFLSADKAQAATAKDQEREQGSFRTYFRVAQQTAATSSQKRWYRPRKFPYAIAVLEILIKMSKRGPVTWLSAVVAAESRLGWKGDAR